MTLTLATALVDALDDAALDTLADRLASRLSARLGRQNDADGWLRGADSIGEYIGAPRSRVYALASAGRIAVHKDGSALIARKSELDAWLCNGGARRP